MSPLLFLLIALVAVVSFGAGLLVGRRNPKIADTAATLANDAKTAGANVATAAKSAASGKPGPGS